MVVHPFIKVLGLTAMAVSLQMAAPSYAAESNRSNSTAVIVYEGSHEDVEVKGTKLTYRIREEQFAQGSPSATPTKVVTVTKETVVEPAEVEKLMARIRSTKFFQLKNEYGVGPNARHYPYEIRIKDGGRDKTVTYRSGGDESQKPQDFSKVEDYLLDFAKKETTVNR